MKEVGESEVTENDYKKTKQKRKKKQNETTTKNEHTEARKTDTRCILAKV